jgi:hypothetical protein
MGYDLSKYLLHNWYSWKKHTLIWEGLSN